MKQFTFGGLLSFIGLSSCLAAGEPWSSPHGTYTPSHLWSAPAKTLNPYGEGLPQPFEPNQKSFTPLHIYESKSDPKERSKERERVMPSCNRTDCAPRR